LQTAADVVALAIDCRIDLVSDAVVALVFGESNIVSARSDPHLIVFPFERSLPNAEMMAACHHGDRFGHLVAKILFTPK
jgi:hypothetical protein